jgi:hypothetical protein
VVIANRSAPRLAVLLVVAAAALLSSTAASAANPNPGDSSGVAQYVEQLPTSSGSVATHRGGGAARLTPKARAAVQAEGGEDATLLGEIAVSKSLGAPSRTAKPSSHATGKTASRKPAPAAATTSGADGSSSVLWVALAVAAATLGAGGAALARYRGRR